MTGVQVVMTVQSDFGSLEPWLEEALVDHDWQIVNRQRTTSDDAAFATLAVSGHDLEGVISLSSGDGEVILVYLIGRPGAGS